jgi:hypothetical protein
VRCDHGARRMGLGVISQQAFHPAVIEGVHARAVRTLESFCASAGTTVNQFSEHSS